MLLLLIAASLGFAVTLFTVPYLVAIAGQKRLFCRTPDLHHIHTIPIPRAGGVALALAFVVVEIFIAVVAPEHQERTPSSPVVLGSAVAMLFLGLWDDLKPLGAKKKLVGQMLIASFVWYFGIGIEHFKIPFTERLVFLGGWGFPVTLVWLVGMTNLINLIDGVDGLAGGISLMLMTLLVWIGHEHGMYELLAAGLGGALLGFLRYNFPPATIYLGDGGAYFLGFLIGVFSLVNSHKGTVFAALLAPLFVLALPILDTLLAIARRALRGLPIFRPDRRHIHHHLLRSGLSRRQVVLSLYGVSILFMILGLVAFASRGKFVPILLGLLVLILLLCAGQFSFSREWFAVGRVVSSSLLIRKEVQYAMALTRWLSLEGSRHDSVNSLWLDFAFAARKLGFTSLRLVLEDGERKWRKAKCEKAEFKTSHTLEGGRFGVLELEAMGVASPGDGASGFTITDANHFEIACELLAESWLKACRRLRAANIPIRFHPGNEPEQVAEPVSAAPFAQVVGGLEPG